ncbi:MAG TPA: hypothetical protein PK340_01945 [Bacilli bacterium]|nr:hypothetical protein [Bacilli bacterium]
MKKRILISLVLAPILLAGLALKDNPRVTELDAVYSPYQIPNGGFESGNLNGWTSFRIWKNESGMAAFDSSLVTNGTYFSSYPYGRDGSYNLGITSGSITWDQTSERMGYLRSSDFILGGSGWISFKLGGGKHPSFAYMSVRQVSDDVEVARFANRHFNDTAKATTQYGSSITNAEAFLFQYYFDLSSVVSLSTNLYILLCDTSAYDWSILSADSFVTYIASAPSPSADQTAVNILPTISGIDTADNTIKNGYFSSDFSSWDLSNDSANGWGRKDSAAKSNNSGGDGAIGILRSSAFLVTTNKYIRFDWAGGLRYDKQIFISVKETGTNIEKLRFVRRDNLSSKESESYDNHMLNLSSLSSEKMYYLEFADGRSGGWGISYVDAIRTVPESEWNSVTSGDRAVSISNLPLSFPVSYIQEAASYGAYFIEQTAEDCANLEGDEVPWTTLATEYGTLSNDAKDYFVNSETTEANVVAARDRYVFLYNKYGSSMEWEYFLKSSTGVNYSPAQSMNEPRVPLVNDELAYVLLVGGAIFMIASAAYIVFRKRYN